MLHGLRLDRCTFNLTFHHVDPKTKSFGMSMRTDVVYAYAGHTED